MLEGIQGKFLFIAPESFLFEEEFSGGAYVLADDAGLFVFHVDAEVIGEEVEHDGVVFDGLEDEVIGSVVVRASVLPVRACVGDGEEKSVGMQTEANFTHRGMEFFLKVAGELGAQSMKSSVVGTEGRRGRFEGEEGVARNEVVEHSGASGEVHAEREADGIKAMLKVHGNDVVLKRGGEVVIGENIGEEGANGVMRGHAEKVRDDHDAFGLRGAAAEAGEGVDESMLEFVEGVHCRAGNVVKLTMMGEYQNILGKKSLEGVRQNPGKVLGESEENVR